MTFAGISANSQLYFKHKTAVDFPAPCCSPQRCYTATKWFLRAGREGRGSIKKNLLWFVRAVWGCAQSKNTAHILQPGHSSILYTRVVAVRNDVRQTTAQSANYRMSLLVLIQFHTFSDYLQQDRNLYNGFKLGQCGRLAKVLCSWKFLRWWKF